MAITHEKEVLIARNVLMNVVKLDPKAGSLEVEVMPADHRPKSKPVAKSDDRKDAETERAPPSSKFVYDDLSGLTFYPPDDE